MQFQQIVVGLLGLASCSRYLVTKIRKPEELNPVVWICWTVESGIVAYSYNTISEGGPSVVLFLIDFVASAALAVLSLWKGRWRLSGADLVFAFGCFVVVALWYYSQLKGFYGVGESLAFGFNLGVMLIWLKDVWHVPEQEDALAWFLFLLSDFGNTVLSAMAPEVIARLIPGVQLSMTLLGATIVFVAIAVSGLKWLPEDKKQGNLNLRFLGLLQVSCETPKLIDATEKKRRLRYQAGLLSKEPHWAKVG